MPSQSYPDPRNALPAKAQQCALRQTGFPAPPALSASAASSTSRYSGSRSPRISSPSGRGPQVDPRSAGLSSTRSSCEVFIHQLLDQRDVSSIDIQNAARRKVRSIDSFSRAGQFIPRKAMLLSPLPLPARCGRPQWVFRRHPVSACAPAPSFTTRTTFGIHRRCCVSTSTVSPICTPSRAISFQRYAAWQQHRYAGYRPLTTGRNANWRQRPGLSS